VVCTSGREATVDIFGPGGAFGELAAADTGAEPCNSTVTAVSDLDVLVIGPRELAAKVDIPVSGTQSSTARRPGFEAEDA
jgi:CRP-like cAMP-binding protein